MPQNKNKGGCQLVGWQGASVLAAASPVLKPEKNEDIFWPSTRIRSTKTDSRRPDQASASIVRDFPILEPLFQYACETALMAAEVECEYCAFYVFEHWRQADVS
jgi:hypothetical protein